MQWLPYLYVYGIGSIVFFAGLFVAWRAGAIDRKRIVWVLLAGLGLYAAVHAFMQTAGAPGPLPETGTKRGTTGFIGTWIDAAVVVGYFVVIIAVGSYFARFTRSTTDFFFGGRRFKGWLVALSCVATTIGSYSFLKYASVGYRFGLSSTMNYLNDWFWMPLWMLVWLPIIYYGRLRSIPEYFEKRFDRRARMVATLILLVFLLGYISINYFTLGKAIHTLTGWPVFWSAVVAACGTAVYVAFGGQTSVIMTDLAQALLLLGVGIGLFVAGVYHVGGWEAFWSGLPAAHRMGLAGFNSPSSFHTMGIFWQDAMVGGMAFYFINQGVMMRFMSARNVAEGRKAVALVVLIVMPLAAVAVAGVGWVGRVMADTGAIDPMTDPDGVFVIVSNILAMPGVFGLIMAALVAALMSTVDTLVTATSAVIVNDIWTPYFAKEGEEDRATLRVARITTVASSALALSIVPLFMAFDSIFSAHAAFTAAVIPPMAVTLLLGITWPRFGTKSALVTLLGGSAAVALSLAFPEVIEPFAQGAEAGGEGMKAHKFMRAFYGLCVSGGLGVVSAFIFREAPEDHPHLVAGSERDAMREFKGAEPKEPGPSISLDLEIVAEDRSAPARADELTIQLHPDDQARIGAEPGDLIVVSAPGGWHGGLKSVHGRIDDEPGEISGTLQFPRELEAYAGFRHYDHVVVSLEG
jgi:SSS family solute:Na+ symporter